MPKLLTDKEMNILKNIELQILIEIDRICRENSINYSIAFGTLIGAIRHKGFIPWDDDIDIMMERDEYNKFCSVVENRLDKKFYFVTFENCKKYALPFAKVMAKDTLYSEMSTGGNGAPKGIWVDIFPVDKTSEEYKERVNQYSTAQKIKGRLFCIANYSFGKSGLSLVLYRARKLLYLFDTHEKLVVKYNANASLYCGMNNCKKLVCLGDNIGVEKGTYEKKWFSEYIEIEFENHSFMCIKYYDEFLKHIYGDYMKLPPLEEQAPHHYVDEFYVKENWFRNSSSDN